MDPCGFKFYDGSPYSIIEYGPLGKFSIWTQGPFSMGSIFYMTPALLTKNTETVEYNATRNNFFSFLLQTL